MKAKALWHNTPEQSAIIENGLTINPEQVHLKSLYSLISMGTERLVSLGEVPFDLLDQMKVPNMMGDFALPIKYGYSLVGESAEGKQYHVMHPHQSDCAVDPNVLFEVPATLPPSRAVLISNMETVINAIWDAGDLVGKRIAICGFGGVGALLAMTLRCHYNLDVDFQELNKWRNQKAMDLGYKGHQDSHNYDIIFHTSASGAGLQWCIDHLGYEGRVVELSWYGNRFVDLSLGHAFHYKRLQIISSQVSTIPGHMTDEYDYKSRKALAAKYLLDDRYDILITDIIPFDQSAEFFNQLRKGKQGDGLIWLIQY